MLSIILALMQQPLAPIVVTATAASPLPTAVVDSAAMRRDIRPSLAVVATAVPGVRAVTTGAIIAQPMIRGLGGARVLVLDAGHRLEHYAWDDEDGPALDPRHGETIEVIRGPASLLYGSDAIGGVINSVPEPLPDEPGRHLRTTIFASSNNPGAGVAADGEWARDALSGRISLSGHFAGPIHTPAGELENTGYSSLNGEAALGVHGRAGRASLRIAHYGGEFKLLEANPPATPAPPGVESGPARKVDDTRIQLQATNGWLETRAQLQRHGTMELEGDTAVINLALTTGTFELMAHRPHSTVGMSVLVQDNQSTGVVPLVPDATTRRAALFAIQNFVLGRVLLLAGIRGDVMSRNRAAITGDVGAVYDLGGGVSLSTNIGRGFRAPNLFELYTNGPRLGEARYEIGDSTLGPETSLNLDAGLRWRAARFRGEITAFRNRIDDFIFIRPTPNFSTPDSLRIYRYDHARATLVGGEVSLALDVSSRVTTWLRGDVVKGDNDSRREPLPLMPPVRVVAGARLHHPRWYAGAEAEAVDRQNRLAPLDIATAGYVLLGLEGGYQLRLGARPVSIDARLRNATNKAYRNYLNRYKEFALDAGRSLEVRVATEF